MRAARDGTFDTEEDDSAELFAERDPIEDLEHLQGRLAQLAHAAVSWVVEDHRKDETFEDEREAG